jgi:signal transduction histidine kinase
LSGLNYVNSAGMKRTVFVIVLGVVALALLVGAALRSRAIPLSSHIAYSTLESDLTRIKEDFATLVAALETSWASSQAPGEAASALHQQIVGSVVELERSLAEIPGSASQRERMQNNLERLRGPMGTVDELTTTLLSEQTAYAEAVSLLQVQGPEIVRVLRAASFDSMAATVFQALAATIDYARPGIATTPADVRRFAAVLDRDLRLAGGTGREAAPLLAAVNRILDTKGNIESRLDQLSRSPLPEYVDDLDGAATAAYTSSVSSADTARTMLAVYAIVMLLAVGIIGFRLHGSYRQINRANSELSVLNESLEQRVDERTADLSKALTELKESQVQLVQAEKMSSLGQLVAGISHEINTPLLYLANNASMIAERVGVIDEFVHSSARTLSLNPATFKDRAEYQTRLIEGLRTLKILLRDNELEASIEEIKDLNRDSIEGLADLTGMAQSLKDFSRLDRAPVDSFDVNAGIEKTLTIARNVIKHKAEVRKFFGDLPPIACSPSKINQVFLNLITNAAQAIETQGEIVITTKLLDPDHVAISIMDNGCGIPEENLGKIRDPFFTTKEVGAGTGLGLSIVDEIIRSHGGELLVESRVGVGSTFTVVLPVRPAAPFESAPDDDTATVPDLAEAV